MKISGAICNWKGSCTYYLASSTPSDRVPSSEQACYTREEEDEQAVVQKVDVACIGSTGVCAPKDVRLQKKRIVETRYPGKALLMPFLVQKLEKVPLQLYVSDVKYW